jgi:hypothetical protein
MNLRSALCTGIVTHRRVPPRLLPHAAPVAAVDAEGEPP